MPFQRLPESVQTLYAELLEQTIQAEAEAALLSAPQGTFVSKTVKGGTYWYLQRTEGIAGASTIWGGSRPRCSTGHR